MRWKVEVQRETARWGLVSALKTYKYLQNLSGAKCGTIPLPRCLKACFHRSVAVRALDKAGRPEVACPCTTAVASHFFHALPCSQVLDLLDFLHFSCMFERGPSEWNKIK